MKAKLSKSFRDTWLGMGKNKKYLRFFIILGIFIFLLMADSPIREFVHTSRKTKELWILKYVTDLGDGSTQVAFFLLLLVQGYVYKVERLKKLGKAGLYTLLGSGIVTQGLKQVVRRARPDISLRRLLMGPTLQDMSGSFGSFPSGHALSSFALAVVLAAFYPEWRPLFYAFAFLISLSRIYLERHFASDVYAGIILGWWVGKGYVRYFLEPGQGENLMNLYTSFLKKLQNPKTYVLILGLVLFSGFLFFYGLTGFTLFDVDEAVFSEATREMMETGDWITPHYNYSNRYDKPILFYWMMALSYKLFGINELGARFWSPTMAVALVVMTFYFVKRTLDRRTALLSALILSTCLEMYYLSHVAVTDMTLCFFIAAALYSFFLGYQSRSDVNAPTSLQRGGYWGSYVFMALATLTKGPIGFVIPLMAIVPFTIAMGTWRQVLKEARIFSGSLLFLAVAGPWYALEIAANGWEYINSFFIYHNITRYLAVDRGHRGPVYYYLGIILVGFFPWSAFVPHALARTLSVRRRGRRDRAFVRGLEDNPQDPSATGLPLLYFVSIWFFTVLGFFSFAKTKLPNYVLPLFPAMAILVGKWWSDYLSNGWTDLRGMKISRLILALLTLLLTLTAAATPFILGKLAVQYPGRFIESLDVRAGCWLLAGSFLMGGLGGALTLPRFKRASFILLLITMVLMNFIALTKIVPPVNAYFQAALHDLAQIVGDRMLPEGKLIIYGKIENPSIVFYSRRPFIRVRNKEALKDWLQSPQQVLVITKTPLMLELQGEVSFFLWKERQGYALLCNQPGYLSRR